MKWNSATCYLALTEKIDEMSRAFPQILTSVHQELKSAVLMLPVLIQMDLITAFVNLDFLKMGGIA